MTESSAATAFDDLLTANRTFAESFALADFDGVARAGVAVVTCMDSRIDPLGMLGLSPGDAKILRNPGGRVTDAAMLALVIGVNLLDVERILVVQHTLCAMASDSEQALRQRLSEASGKDTSWMSIEVISDQPASIMDDVTKVRAHPLIGPSTVIGGFLYDVETGLLELVC